MPKIIAALLVIAFTIGVLVAVVASSSWYAQKLDAVQECVALTARVQGFAGNPYSKEAWDLFVSHCQ